MSSDHADLCRLVLAVVATVYRPITLSELTALIESIEEFSDDLEVVKDIIGVCGSFLTTRENSIHFVHLSVNDFLHDKAFGQIFTSGKQMIHREVFFKSMHAMSKTLRRDVYDVHSVGCLISAVKRPEQDPLGTSRYSCLH